MAQLRRRRLGRTGLLVCELGLGAMDTPTAVEGAETLATALDLGIDFVDTAREYAGSEFSGGGILDFAKGEDTIAFAFSNAQVSAADLRNLLRNSTGNVLELSLLGAGFEDFGQLVLNVPVSTLDASDFVIS